MTITAIAVERVSKKKQAGQDRYSIPAQDRAIREYCEREGIVLLDTYIEPGTSAYVTDIKKIKGLDRALQRIEAGEANALIVHESSRLARTERLTNEIADRLEACGAKFINVSMGGFDYSTPEGRMILSQEAAMNTYWSRKTGEHSRKGKKEQWEQGLHIGKVPFGYTHAVIEVEGTRKTTRKLPMVVVPEEAELIKKAFEDHALGKNAHAIAREWNALGVRPRSHKGIEYFQPESVRDILERRLYAGYVEHLGNWRQGRHEAIISEELFEAAQKPKQQTNRRVHPPKDLRGLAVCPEGHPVYVLAVRHSPKDPHRKHYYYREPSNDFERPCSQRGKLWNANEVDGKVEEVLRAMAMDSTWLEYVEDQARHQPGFRNAAQERDRIKAKLDRLQDEYLDGNVPKEKYDRVKGECLTQLAQLAAQDQPLTEAVKRLTCWWDLWENASPEAKNETCRLVFESAVIDFVERDLTLVPHAEFAPLFDARLTYVERTRPGRG